MAFDRQGKPDDRQPRIARRKGFRRGRDRQAVFRIQGDVCRERKDAKAGGCRPLLEQAHALVEERHVTPELVDRKSPEQRPLLRLQKPHGPENRREHAAPLDVRHEQPGRLDGRDQPEIREVHAPEVELGDAAGAFDDDDVETPREVVVRGADVRAELVRVSVIASGRERLPRSPVDNHLAVAAARLEQDRIHRGLRFQAAGLRLRYLGTPNLPTGATGIRMIRHVLRFEGSHGHALAAQPRADRRHHPALAGVGGRAADEQRSRSHISFAAGPATRDTVRRYMP